MVLSLLRQFVHILILKTKLVYKVYETTRQTDENHTYIIEVYFNQPIGAFIDTQSVSWHSKFHTV